METDASITSEATFHRLLVELISRASSNGVDVEGGWPVVNGDPDAWGWDVEITGLERPE